MNVSWQQREAESQMEGQFSEVKPLKSPSLLNQSYKAFSKDLHSEKTHEWISTQDDESDQEFDK